MNIVLNGKEVQTSSKTLAELIAEHEIHVAKIAVEVDGNVIPKSQLQGFALKHGQKIEIITFVGGG